MVIELDIKINVLLAPVVLQKTESCFLKMPVLIFFLCKSYLDLYVFFYVKICVLFILIPTFIIVYVLFLSFAFSRLELGQIFAQRSSITRACEVECSCQSRGDYTQYPGSDQKRFGSEGNDVYCPSGITDGGPMVIFSG